MRSPLDLVRGAAILPRSSPEPAAEPGAVVCPHCWMVNPGPFRICGRCGADMTLLLQESGGLRRTAPVQSPVPVAGTPTLSRLQRVFLAGFVALLALAYLLTAFVPVHRAGPERPPPSRTPAP